MSFLRYILADMGMAYIPKVGNKYRYASEGPFELGPVATPRELREGHVQYELLHQNGQVTQQVCTAAAFASMFRAIAKSSSQQMQVVYGEAEPMNQGMPIDICEYLRQRASDEPPHFSGVPPDTVLVHTDLLRAAALEIERLRSSR